MVKAEAIETPLSPVPPDSCVLLIFTSKLFDICILQTLSANPAPSKAFKGTGGYQLRETSVLKRPFCRLVDTRQQDHFKQRSTHIHRLSGVGTRTAPCRPITSAGGSIGSVAEIFLVCLKNPLQQSAALRLRC